MFFPYFTQVSEKGIKMIVTVKTHRKNDDTRHSFLASAFRLASGPDMFGVTKVTLADGINFCTGETPEEISAKVAAALQPSAPQPKARQLKPSGGL